MGLPKQPIKENKTFDKDINILKQKQNHIKDVVSKEKSGSEIAELFLELKEKAQQLTSECPERKKLKKEFIIDSLTQAACCYLKENMPKETIKMISELELFQDIKKEKNTQVLMYIGRAHLLLENYEKAYEYFEYAHESVDETLKKEIESILKIIASRKDKKIKINNITDQLAEIKQMDCFQSRNRNNDLSVTKIDINSETNTNPAKKSKTSDIIVINLRKTSTTILTEFMGKFGDTIPKYELIKTVTQNSNSQLFTMSCYCIGHTVEGSGTNKKLAKEDAAKAMIDYLKHIGKLQLIEN